MKETDEGDRQRRVGDKAKQAYLYKETNEETKRQKETAAIVAVSLFKNKTNIYIYIYTYTYIYIYI